MIALGSSLKRISFEARRQLQPKPVVAALIAAAELKLPSPRDHVKRSAIRAGRFSHVRDEQRTNRAGKAPGR